MDKILFINACVRKRSRTRDLAGRVLKELDGEITEVRPAEETEPIKDEDFINFRNAASMNNDFSDRAFSAARQFAQADAVVVAAPYWDLSFPAVLKAYFEQINVLGLTFEYTENGTPRGLCRAKKLIYVSTAGGPVISDEYGYGYVKTLAQAFYGIEDVSQIKAEGLDVIGADVEGILDDAFEKWIRG